MTFIFGRQNCSDIQHKVSGFYIIAAVNPKAIFRIFYAYWGARGGAVGWGNALQAEVSTRNISWE
jgi:hypothetical protein